MPKPISPTRFAIPLLIIALGVGWLLTTQGYVPSVDWLWTIGLAGIGVLTFAFCGIDKLSMVVGPFFLTASLLSFLRQSGRIKLETEVPILIIMIGVLLLIVQFPAVPKPKWFVEPAEPEKSEASVPRKLKA